MYNLYIYKYINAMKCVTKMWKKVQVIVQSKKHQKNYDLYKNLYVLNGKKKVDVILNK